MDEDQNHDLQDGEGAGFEGENLTESELGEDDYDGFGDPTALGEDEVAAEIAAETPAPAYRPNVPTFQPTANPHMDRVRARLAEVGLEDIADDIHAAMRHEQQQGFTAQTYAGSHLAELQSADPAYYQEHSREIGAALASLPPELRATQQGAWLAWQAPIMNRIAQTGNLADAVKMQRGAGAAQSRQPQTTRTIAPVPKTPSASVAPGGGGAPRRSQEAQGTKSAGSRAAKYLQGLGYSASEAREKSGKIGAD